MAQSRGRSSFPRTRASGRRLTEWAQGPAELTAASVTSNTTAVWTTATEALEQLTIVRLRGELTVFIEVATSVGDGFLNFSVGIGVASIDAISAGAGSLPTPDGDDDWGGWIWHSKHGALVSLETTEVARGPMGAIRETIDSKAMRKMSRNEGLFGSIQFAGEVGTATARFNADTRMLIKLA